MFKRLNKNNTNEHALLIARYEAQYRKLEADLSVTLGKVDPDKKSGNLAYQVGHIADYAAAISDWGSFEREVDSCLWTAIGAGDIIGACITEQIQSVRSKLIIIEDILLESKIPEKEVARLRKFRNSIEKLTKSRNRIVHDPHYFFNGVFVVSRSRDAARPGEVLEPVSEQVMNEFSKSCYQKAMELRDLCEELFPQMNRNHDLKGGDEGT